MLAATLKRNLERPAVDFARFDAARVHPKEREALAFVVAQTAYIERVSPRNLANLAACIELPLVRACFAAQIHDEIAHGAMLSSWLDALGMRREPHGAAVFGAHAAAFTQRDPWLGTRNAALLIEYYASAMLDELAPRVEEPCLREIIAHIQKDEARHKVIAAEAVRALRAAGSDKRLIARVLGPVVDAGTLAYFRHVFGWFIDKRARARAAARADPRARPRRGPRRDRMTAGMLERRPHLLLVAFLTALAALNAWRLEAWGSEGFRVYVTHPIMQTTLLDFGCVLAILLVFIHRDAKQHGLTYWWILPTFPVMPTVGILAYFIVRRRRLASRA